LFYDLRVSYFNQGYYSGLDKDTSEYIAASDAQYMSDIGTGFEFYSRSDPPSLTDSRTATAEVKGDLVWQMNQLNEIKFGFQYKKHWLRYWNIYDPKRDFPYINNYNTSPFEAAGYLQDKIEFPFLVINLGLRFDYVNANVIFRENPLDPNSNIQVKPRYQISPRVGIAHPISENTKLHFSYGHFFQNPDYQYFFENSQYSVVIFIISKSSTEIIHPGLTIPALLQRGQPIAVLIKSLGLKIIIHPAFPVPHLVEIGKHVPCSVIGPG
jgi:outer membrane receptor protein involved in Fe transport